MPIIQGGNIIEGATKRPWMNNGVPTNGTSGTLAGVADPGDLLIDYANGNLYQNTNTKASPTWTKYTTEAEPTQHLWTNAGAPTDGTEGTLAGSADPGDLLIDTTNKKVYQNTNTKASPTWNSVRDVAESEIGTGAVTETKIGNAAVSKGKLAGGFFKVNLINGGAAGDHAISGITAADELVTVLQLAADAHLNNMADLTSEFTVGAGKINNTDGTNTTGDKLLVVWLDITS
jgi:hypothetical protein